VNRSQQTKAVFFELRHVFGTELSAGALLRIAARLVAAYHVVTWQKSYGGYTVPDPFFAQEVDLAMNDGGWRVMYFESGQGMSPCDELPDSDIRVQKRIKGFVGITEWPRIETVWP
jgi:hypothetical protein